MLFIILLVLCITISLCLTIWALVKIHKEGYEIYCINLDRRTDRWQASKKLLKDFKVQRVSAIDGKKLKNIDTNIIAKKWDTTENAKWDVNTKPGLIKRLTPGEIGCALSHYNIWKKQEPYSIVLEDDIKLNKNFTKAKFEKCVKYVTDHPQVDILYLGGIDVSKKQAQGHIDKAQFIFCTYAYIITKKGMQRLLDALPIKGPVDLFMSSTLKEKYRMNPFIIDQRDGWDINSDIKHSNH